MHSVFLLCRPQVIFGKHAILAPFFVCGEFIMTSFENGVLVHSNGCNDCRCTWIVVVL